MINDKENGAGALAIIIFLVAFFLIGLAAIFSFILTNKTYEYKINNKTYVVYGSVLKIEELLSKEETLKLIELGMEDFQDVPDSFKDNKIIITVDNKKVVIEEENDRIKTVYNKDNNHIYYSLEDNVDIYYYKDESLKITDNKENDKNNIEKPDEVKGKTKTLLEGTWVVGVNIEAGVYNLHALSGNGNLIIKNGDGRLKVNELFRVGNEYSTIHNVYLKDYNNVILDNDDTIIIGKDMKVKFNAIK